MRGGLHKAVGSRVARSARIAFSALFWLLVVFHLGLVVQRVGAGELFEVGVLVRYGLSFVLLVGLWALRRQGHSLLWGRRALVVWLAIFMLHASFAGVSDFEPLLADIVVKAGISASAAAMAVAAAFLLVRAARVNARAVRAAWVVNHQFAPISLLLSEASPRRGPPALSR
jgi:hypothetical protein